MEKQYSAGTMSDPGAPLQDAVPDPSAAADHVAQQVGDTLKSAAEHVRAQLPQGGLAGPVADTLTSGIKHAATRLQEEGFGAMIDDVVGIARRYPLQALALGLGVGYFVFRLRRH
jgi:uncharacterized protein YidB (DUF937 family)